MMARRRFSVAKSAMTWSLIGLLSAALLLYTGPFFSPSPGLHIESHLTKDDSLQQSEVDFIKLTKRGGPAYTAAAYPAAQNTGNKLLCYFPMTIAQATARNGGTAIEAIPIFQADYLSAVEGWGQFGGPQEDPANLNTFYAANGITGTPIVNKLTQIAPGLILPDISDMNNLDWGAAVPGTLLNEKGNYFNTFIPENGVIIADNNLSINYLFNKQYGTGWQNNANLAVTHLRQWSDVAWGQWRSACNTAGLPNAYTSVNFIVRKFIDNDTTMGIILQAILNANQATGGAISTTVGNTWATRTVLTAQNNPNEFRAILGSPNGSGAGYFLATHKGALGNLGIYTVGIYVSNGDPYSIPTDGTATSAANIDAAEGEQFIVVFSVTPAIAGLAS